eukprot:g221.t1
MISTNPLYSIAMLPVQAQQTPKEDSIRKQFYNHERQKEAQKVAAWKAQKLKDEQNVIFEFEKEEAERKERRKQRLAELDQQAKDSRDRAKGKLQNALVVQERESNVKVVEQRKKAEEMKIKEMHELHIEKQGIAEKLVNDAKEFEIDLEDGGRYENYGVYHPELYWMRIAQFSGSDGERCVQKVKIDTSWLRLVSMFHMNEVNAFIKEKREKGLDIKSLPRLPNTLLQSSETEFRYVHLAVLFDKIADYIIKEKDLPQSQQSVCWGKLPHIVEEEVPDEYKNYHHIEFDNILCIITKGTICNNEMLGEGGEATLPLNFYN